MDYYWVDIKLCQTRLKTPTNVYGNRLKTDELLFLYIKMEKPKLRDMWVNMKTIP